MGSAADALRGAEKQVVSNGMQSDMRHGLIMIDSAFVFTGQLQKVWDVKNIALGTGGSIDNRLALAKNDLDSKCFANAKFYLGYSDEKWPLTCAFENVEVIHNTLIKLFEGVATGKHNGGIKTAPENTYICSGPYFTDNLDGHAVVVLSDLVAYVREELSKFSEDSDFYENLKAYAFMKIKSMKIADKLKALFEARNSGESRGTYSPEWWAYDNVADAFTNPGYDVTDDEVNSYIEELYLTLLRKCEELLNSENVARYLS